MAIKYIDTRGDPGRSLDRVSDVPKKAVEIDGEAYRFR